MKYRVSNEDERDPEMVITLKMRASEAQVLREALNTFGWRYGVNPKLVCLARAFTAAAEKNCHTGYEDDPPSHEDAK